MRFSEQTNFFHFFQIYETLIAEIHLTKHVNAFIGMAYRVLVA